MRRRERMMESLEQDIREHIERETQENLERGMSSEEARCAAIRKFGNVTRVKEEVREIWTRVWLERAWQDIRYGFRMLAKSPAFTVVAILTLALGIGANTAIFSLIDAVMLRSLPAENPAELVVLKWGARNVPNIHGYMSAGDCPTDMRFGEANPSGCSFSQPLFRRLEQLNAFSGIAAFANSGRLNLSGDGPAAVLTGQIASGEFFSTLGVKAAVGRVWEPADDAPSAEPVAVLNYGYWQSHFGGSREVIGKTIALNNVPFTIIGVAEQRFNGITPGSDYDIWLPLSAAQRIADPMRWQNRQEDAAFWWLTVIGRLKPSASLAQTQAAVASTFRNEMLHGATPLFHGGESEGQTAQQPGPPPEGDITPREIPKQVAPLAPGNRVLALAAPNGPAPGGGPHPVERAGGPAAKPAVDDDPQVMLVSAQTGLAGPRSRFSDPLYVLMLAVGIILLIACANVAGLLLARATARQKEMALRLAMGAGRVRVIRQLLTESVMLSAVGGTLGILFAYWGAHTILSFVSSNQPRPLGFATGVDLRVLGFTATVSLMTGIVFGLAPALRSTRVDLAPALKEGEGSSARLGHGRGKWYGIGNVLVVAQVSLAIVVLVGAGLLIRTLSNLRNVDMGFDAHNVLIFGIDASQLGYTREQVDSFYHDLQARLAATPGVRSASYSLMPLLSNGLLITSFHWPGTPEDQDSEADILEVGPNFFETLHIPLLSGREFTPSDFKVAATNDGTAPSSVPISTIVNQAFVEKYLGKENPLGKQFGQTAGDANRPASAGYEIVGVVRDAKYNSLRREIHAMMYLPQSFGGASFEIRTPAEPQTILPAIREAVAQMNPNLPLYDVQTESQQIDRLLFQERLVARLSGFFGLLALVLACMGLYGLLSYEVSRRTREIGIRLAMGASASSVLRLVLRQGIALAAAGAVIGIGVSLAVTRYLNSMLYEVKANDPLTMIGVAALLTLVALAACAIPARRATRVDPLVALRYE